MSATKWPRDQRLTYHTGEGLRTSGNVEHSSDIITARGLCHTLRQRRPLRIAPITSGHEQLPYLCRSKRPFLPGLRKTSPVHLSSEVLKGSLVGHSTGGPKLLHLRCPKHLFSCERGSTACEEDQQRDRQEEQKPRETTTATTCLDQVAGSTPKRRSCAFLAPLERY